MMRNLILIGVRMAIPFFGLSFFMRIFFTPVEMDKISRSPNGTRNFERVNITLKRDLNSAAKRHARENGYTLSGLITKALVQEIGGEMDRLSRRLATIENDIAALKKTNDANSCSVAHSKLGHHSAIHINNAPPTRKKPK
jgi:hypothetical protein